MASPDVVDFVDMIDCEGEARGVANKIVRFTSGPTEDEVLARCRMVFEYILHYAMAQVNGSDLADFEVEVQTEQEKQCSD